MSLSKIIGAAAGAILGLATAALYSRSILGPGVGSHHTSAYAASIMLGLLLGAGIGAFVGSDDRRS